MPLDNAAQNRNHFRLRILPEPSGLAYRRDFFGNTQIFFSNYQEHQELEILAESQVHIRPGDTVDRAYASQVLWKDWRDQAAGHSKGSYDIVDFSLPSQDVPWSDAIKTFAADCFDETYTLWNVCYFLMNKIHRWIAFEPGFTTVNTPVEEVLREKKGVCQDFAHLMIASLRNMGIPARYVSGYLETSPPPGQKKLAGADASHAWVSVYFPEVGWVDFDPTNNLLPSNQHVTIAYGRDYRDVAPLKGVIFSSGGHQLTVKVDVERVH